MGERRFTSANEQGQYRYLITFAEPGLLRQAGGRFNVEAMAVARDTLVAQQAAHRQAMSNALDRSPEVSHHYLVTHSGMAVWLTADEAKAVVRLPGVVSVEREREYALNTTHGPWFIGADTLWDGTNTPDNSALRGEGMVLGHLDTGIDPAHPSFANDPACGFGSGGVPDKVLSALDCGATDETGLCNGSNPVDTNGHGSHTAGTAAGNFLDETAVPPPIADISGVAPCAHIRAYKVCPGQTCPGAAIEAGMNSILLHGDVDVMNFSISGGTDPWNDGDRLKLDLVEAGVLVAAAAGNTSTAIPNPVGQVNHRGPWVLSVAASSHDGATGAGGLLSASGPGTPPDETRQIAATQGNESPAASEVVDFPIRHFDGQNPGAEGCDSEPAFPANFFENAAALIQRGECPFTEKIANAFEVGAELVIVRNNEPGVLNMATPGQPDVPAYAIPLTAGDALQAFVSDHPDTATIDFDPIAGDVLGDFSLRGPTPPPLQNLSKPDITAPGVGIYAAVPEAVLPEGYNFLSGTSMATPHAAGSALLLRQAHPDWSIPEVISALMTTAKQGGLKENLFDAWDTDDVGGGRVDLTKAALAGLVMDENIQNYLNADPEDDGDVRTLNTPSLRDMTCFGECTWTRTVRNTMEVPTLWQAVGRQSFADIDPDRRQGVADLRGGEDLFQITIEPETFEFTGDLGETQQITVTVTPLENLTAEVAFGEVVFSEAGGLLPDQHLTVAFKGRPPQPVVELNPANLSSVLDEGETDTLALTIGNPGEEPLEWTLTEETPVGGPSGPIIAPEGAPTSPTTPLWERPSGRDSGDIDCNNQPGLIIHDDASGENGFSGNPAVVSQAAYVDKFTPAVYPAEFNAVCLSFLTQGPTSLDLEVVVFDDDGPDGGPGTELGALPVTADALATGLGAPIWNGFDISSLDITVTFGSVYIGARWAPLSPDNVFIGVDLSGPNPPGFAGGYVWTDDVDEWKEILGFLSTTYRAQFIRAVAELGDVDCTLPGWAGIDTQNGTVDPGGSQQVTVTFDAAGLESGVHAANLCLETNDPDWPLRVVPLILTVPGPGVLAAEPGALDFGEVMAGFSQTLSATISNAGEPVVARDLEITTIELSSGAPEFEITGGTCQAGSTVLPADESCTVDIRFAPDSVAPFVGELSVATAGGQTGTVNLAGNGLEAVDDIFSDRFQSNDE